MSVGGQRHGASQPNDANAGFTDLVEESKSPVGSAAYVEADKLGIPPDRGGTKLQAGPAVEAREADS